MTHTASVASLSAVPDALGPATLTVRAPATGEVIGEVPIFTADEVHEAVDRARRAQKRWGALPVHVRAERVAAVGQAFLDHADELVEGLMREVGKPRYEALAHEVMTTIDICHYFTHNAARILADQPLDLHLLKHRRAYVTYKPMGVVGVISPWNYPLVIPMGTVIEALVAGNAVVVKPSEITPLIMLKAREIAVAAGIPEDLFQVITGDGHTGQALIDSGIQKMVFTGAVSTGRRVGAACGERLIPCVLELGGKAALIACDDCDLDLTARAIVYGGFANSGQICISVERVLAHESVHDALVERVVALVKGLRHGDSTQGEVDVGAIIFPKQIDVAEAHIRDAVARGAVVATGGQEMSGPGMFFELTVLTNCTPEMTVMREEIFGPIVPFMKVRDDDEAIRVANDSHLGLYGYVFTADRARGREIAERVEAGTVMVNDVLTGYAAVEAPFGGIKASGYGRVHSDESMRAMCYARHVNYDRVSVPVDKLLWFPYSDGKYKTLLGSLRAVFSSRGWFGKIADLF